MQTLSGHSISVQKYWALLQIILVLKKTNFEKKLLGSRLSTLIRLSGAFLNRLHTFILRYSQNYLREPHAKLMKNFDDCFEMAEDSKITLISLCGRNPTLLHNVETTTLLSRKHSDFMVYLS